MQFRFTKRAEADPEEIADYIARANPERAFSFVVQLRRHCRALVNFPYAAPLRPELGRDIRMAVHDPNLIFYVVLSDLLGNSPRAARRAIPRATLTGRPA